MDGVHIRSFSWQAGCNAVHEHAEHRVLLPPGPAVHVLRA